MVELERGKGGGLLYAEKNPKNCGVEIFYEGVEHFLVLSLLYTFNIIDNIMRPSQIY